MPLERITPRMRARILSSRSMARRALWSWFLAALKTSTTPSLYRGKNRSIADSRYGGESTTINPNERNVARIRMSRIVWDIKNRLDEGWQSAPRGQQVKNRDPLSPGSPLFTSTLPCQHVGETLMVYYNATLMAAALRRSAVDGQNSFAALARVQIPTISVVTVFPHSDRAWSSNHLRRRSAERA